MTPRGQENPLEAAAAEIVRAIGESEEPSSAAVLTLRTELLLRARGANRSSADEEESVDAVIDAFVQAATEGRINAETAGAYVARSLQHRLIDMYRRTTTGSGSRREVPLGGPGEILGYAEDEALARLLDAEAARSDVLQALERAAAERRFTLVRVVSEWLVAAERSGVEPSSREVAKALGLSHTAVNEALRKFREKYLPKRGANP